MVETSHAVVHGMGPAESADLKNFMKDYGGAASPQAEEGDGSFGAVDPLSLAVIGLTALAIRGVILWSQKTKKKVVIRNVRTIERANGDVEKEEFEVTIDAQKAPEEAEKILVALGG